MEVTEWSRWQRVAIAPSQIHGTQLHLTPPQSHYLHRVLRLQASDRFIAMDGSGHGWLAQLIAADLATLVEALTIASELPLPITLLVAMPKGNGMEEIVRQTTELGVSEIVPVLSDRTLLHPSPQKLERWRRIAAEAAEQSERQVIPHLKDPLPWGKALNNLEPQTWRYLCAARGASPLLLDDLTQRLAAEPAPIGVVLASGPEGGFTEVEEAIAIAHQFQPISLGRRILRAVTAPGAAIALVASILESVAVADPSQ